MSSLLWITAKHILVLILLVPYETRDISNLEQCVYVHVSLSQSLEESHFRRRSGEVKWMIFNSALCGIQRDSPMSHQRWVILLNNTRILHHSSMCYPRTIRTQGCGGLCSQLRLLPNITGNLLRTVIVSNWKWAYLPESHSWYISVLCQEIKISLK